MAQQQTPEKQARGGRTRRAYLPAAQRRQSILEAAQRVFAHAGYNGARIRDIAKEAGVNQATLFEHFTSKEDLFVEAVVRPLVSAIHDVHGQVEVIDAAPTPAEKYDIARTTVGHHIADMERILPLLTATLFSDMDRGRDFYLHHLAPVIRSRGEAMRKVIRPGYDPGLVGLISFGMLFALAMDRIFGAPRPGEEDAPPPVVGNIDLSEIATQYNRLSASGFAVHPERLVTRLTGEPGQDEEMPGGL